MKLYAVNSIFSIFLRGTAALISQISFSRDWKMHKLKNGFSFHFVLEFFCELFVEQSYQDIEKITLLSGRQSPRDLVMGRGSKLSPCHTSVTASKLCYTTLSILWHVYSIYTMVHHNLVKNHLVLATFVPFLWHVTKTCCQPYHETSVCISLSLECNTLRCDRQPW